jgi:uncharacterized membrane protein SpoIIM required for sporulation
MFEMLVSPKEAEKRPERLFLIGFFYATLSLVITYFLFSKNDTFAKHSSILLITFCVMFSIPFMYFLLRVSEFKEIMHGKGKTLFKEHYKSIIALLFLFVGFTAAFTLSNLVLPQESVGKLFGSQIKDFCRINMPSQLEQCLEKYGIEGIGMTGFAISGQREVSEIFINNMYVLLFVLIFSLALGAGAIFILAWNASVIGTAIGMIVKTSLGNIGVLVAYFIHGIPEIAAYFFAALAGGIVSVAIIRKDLDKEKSKNIFTDFFILMIIAIIILLIASILEVYISPSFY